MRRAFWAGIVIAGILGCSPTGSESGESAGKTRTADKSDKAAKGNEVNLDGLRSAAPAAWKEEEPSSQMRLYQFKLPRVKDDKDDALLVIFRDITGTAKQNVERWKGQFEPPEGKKIDDVAKVRTLKVADADVTYLDVRGTYIDKPPFAPNAPAKKRAGYRMLAVQMEGENHIYHMKLTGPAATVDHYKTGFDKWLEGFKK